MTGPAACRGHAQVGSVVGVGFRPLETGRVRAGMCLFAPLWRTMAELTVNREEQGNAD
jgi:hypothetical protein